MLRAAVSTSGAYSVPPQIAINHLLASWLHIVAWWLAGALLGSHPLSFEREPLCDQQARPLLVSMATSRSVARL